MMRRFVIIIALTILFMVGCTNKVQASTENNWLTNMEQAQKEAKLKDVPILINFTGSDWCGWCTKLDEEVFDTPSFSNYAKESLVLLKLDFPKKIEQPQAVKEHNEKYLKMFGVRGFPTILFVDGKLDVLSQMGYQAGGPDKYIQSIEASFSFPKSNFNNTVKTDNGITWVTSLEKAKELAAQNDKKIFVDFTGSDWCIWCTKIDEEILDTGEFREFAEDNLIMLYLDFPQNKVQPEGMGAYNQQIASKFGIEGFPTILILDKDGNELNRLGYEKAGVSKFIKDISASITVD